MAAEGSAAPALGSTLRLDGLPPIDGSVPLASAPIMVEGRTWGTLAVVGRARRQPPSATLVRDLGELAELAAVATQGAADRDRLERAQEAGVSALASLLDLRDGYRGGHGEAVVELAVKLGRKLGFEGSHLEDLRTAARLRDVGKIGVPDEVLHKTGRLAPGEWDLVRRHAELGARALEAIPGFEEIAAAVRSHHERFSGGGYPDGLQGEDIPLAARIIAVAEAFQALTSDRPYRGALAERDAVALLQRAAGTDFDPTVVEALVEDLPRASRFVREEPVEVEGEGDVAPSGRGGAPGRGGAAAGRGGAAVGRGGAAAGRGGAAGLREAFARLSRIPALREPHARLVEALERPDTRADELVAILESDVALTVTALHCAARVGGGEVDGIPAAVRVAPREELLAAVRDLPSVDFFQRVSGWRVLPEHLRLHAIATHRAMDRLTRALEHPQRDTLLAAALLHDVGKLVLQQADPRYPDVILGEARTPAARVAAELRAFGIDHASAGGVLLRRWGVPEPIAEAVERHHAPDATGPPAVLRLADLLSHYAQARPVDPQQLLTAATAAGLDPGRLRALMYELTLADSAVPRAVEPSPLTAQETNVLRALATGKVYKEIAADLGLSTGTVRTHCFNVYRKLGVSDRANAVMLAAQSGWI